jgi:hypothetical protein
MQNRQGKTKGALVRLLTEVRTGISFQDTRREVAHKGDMAVVLSYCESSSLSNPLVDVALVKSGHHVRIPAYLVEALDTLDNKTSEGV